jgi:hypothetical protein
MQTHQPTRGGENKQCAEFMLIIAWKLIAAAKANAMLDGN